MFCAYTSTFYVLAKSFYEKKTVFMSRVKKTKFSVKNGFSRHFFVFFTQVTENAGFPQKLGVRT